MNHENSTKKVLVFSPHPDDHLCCAGTLMFLRDKGFKIHEIVATGGEAGAWWVSESEKKTDFDKKDLQDARKNETTKASQIIGIEKTSFWGLSDSKVTFDFEVVKKIVTIIRAEKPELVLGGNPRDYHSDHRELSKMVKEGIERASWNNEPQLGGPWKVPIVLYFEGFYLGKPHVVVDITAYLERKKKVVDVYASQIYPSERRLLESMNNYRGFFIRDHDILAAEAFEIPEEFPVYFNRLVEIFGRDR